MLFFIARTGETDKVLLLLCKGAKVNSYENTENSDEISSLTPLQCALLNGQNDTAELLLDMGADAKLIGKYTSTTKEAVGNALTFCSDSVRQSLRNRIERDGKDVLL